MPYKLESDRPDCAEWTRVAKQLAGPTATRTPNLHERRSLIESADGRVRQWRRGTEILREPQPKPFDSDAGLPLTPTGLPMEGVYTYRALFKIARSNLAKPSPTDRDGQRTAVVWLTSGAEMIGPASMIL